VQIEKQNKTKQTNKQKTGLFPSYRLVTKEITDVRDAFIFSNVQN
jgi:hypothetical protein